MKLHIITFKDTASDKLIYSAPTEYTTAQLMEINEDKEAFRVIKLKEAGIVYNCLIHSVELMHKPKNNFKKTSDFEMSEIESMIEGIKGVIERHPYARTNTPTKSFIEQFFKFKHLVEKEIEARDRQLINQ